MRNLSSINQYDAPTTIIVSRSLTQEVLERNTVTSSSEKFQRSFAKEYSKLTNTSIIHIGKSKVSAVRLCAIDANLYTSSYCNLFFSIRRASRQRPAVIIITGYDPRVVIPCILLRVIGYKAFSFIYDTHIATTVHRSFFRRHIINLYYEIGFTIAKLFDGWIVLNDRFITKKGIRIRYLKTLVGGEANNSQTVQVDAPKCTKVFLFSGTLNDENGISILLAAFDLINDHDVELHIYGYGPYINIVERAAKYDKRIRFFSTLMNTEIIERQSVADYIIHLRDPSSIVSEYSYPSKLIEYLCSNKPVLSNIFPEIGDVSDYVVVIDRYDVESVRKTIAGVLNGTIRIPDTSSNSVKLCRNRRWNKIAAEVQNFVMHDWVLQNAEPKVVKVDPK